MRAVGANPGTCFVWWARPGALRARHLRLLDPVEDQRRLAYRDEADRERFALAAAVLRLGAARVLGTDPAVLRVDRGCGSCGRPHARPRVAGGQVHVSVSHSARRVVVAVSALGPVGVDVERASGDTTDLVERLLGPGEVVTRPGDLFVYWTRKESVVKATGAGLLIALKDVLVSGPRQHPRLLSYPGTSAPVASMLDLEPGRGYVAALTVLHPVMPQVRQLDAAGLLETST